jgi:hypothetical protein
MHSSSSDFPKNYSLILQDEVQGYYWINAWTTFLSFSVYFKGVFVAVIHEAVLVMLVTEASFL